MANRYYTVLIIPEKNSKVRRIVVPAWLARFSIVALFLGSTLSTIFILNYWFIMGQIGENKELRLENRRLRQEVQLFQTRMDAIEKTVERVRAFSTRLRVITNLEERGSLQSYNTKLPDAATNIGTTQIAASEDTSSPSEGPYDAIVGVPSESGSGDTHAVSSRALAEESPEDALLREQFGALDNRLNAFHAQALEVEQILQDEYELLADQKSFLGALPTRRPAVGYFTSGFGVRKSPYGGRDKMHEGLDIANHIGTTIFATADGTVTFAETKPGYGQTVIVDHGYGLETWYGHTKKILVERGKKVRRGDRIALLGNSGRSTGPHLHYEVRVNGTPVDPLSYILEN